MLQKLKLKNFKCFESVEVGLAALTLLCGVNGMGKSSIFQALLVLRQSYQAGELLHGRLLLGGELADLGNGADVMYEDALEDQIGFTLCDSRAPSPCALMFEYLSSADQLTAFPTPSGSGSDTVPAVWQRLPPFGDPLVYVNAERIGPRKFHARSETMARKGNIGVRGEYAMNLVNERQLELVQDGDPRAMGSGRRLIDLIDAWLQEITPGAHLVLEPVTPIDAVIAGFTFDRAGDVASKRYRATNVGFGLSYALPVLLALLAPKGSLVLIENPEAHLHPRGQTKLGELAARAAAAGVQVIAETHSDHFMDGVRIAVRDQVIAASAVAFHYFTREGSQSILTSPQIDENGRLSVWPDGFFDQHEENSAKLLAPRPTNA
jgi:predicted ATPase